MAIHGGWPLLLGSPTNQEIGVTVKSAADCYATLDITEELRLKSAAKGTRDRRVESIDQSKTSPSLIWRANTSTVVSLSIVAYSMEGVHDFRTIVVVCRGPVCASEARGFWEVEMPFFRVLRGMD